MQFSQSYTPKGTIMSSPRLSVRTKIFALLIFSLFCLSLLITPGSKAQGTIPIGTPSIYLPLITKSTYLFNVVEVSNCLPQPAGNWFEGTTYINGQPANGYKVVFSYSPTTAPITAPMISGPHDGYPGWRTGYYSHIIRASGTVASDWYVWVVDDMGNRISEFGHWVSTGPGDGCNQAVVDFDSR